MKNNWKAWARTLHVYTSTFALLSTLFFGTTGFMLNHSEWFGIDDTVTQTRQGHMAKELVAGRLDRLAIVERLRRTEGVTGLLTDFETEKNELHIKFARPGRLTDATIDRKNGALELHIESGGLARLLTEFHKGDGTGSWGGRLIDLSSIALIVISITGLLLWLTLRRRRKLGLATLVLGGGVFVCVSLYCML